MVAKDRAGWSLLLLLTLLAPQVQAQARAGPPAGAPARALADARRLIETNDLAGAQALVEFERAVALSPALFDAQYLALALQRSGARVEARTHFDEAQRLAPYLRPAEGKR